MQSLDADETLFHEGLTLTCMQSTGVAAGAKMVITAGTTAADMLEASTLAIAAHLAMTLIARRALRRMVTH
jgi:hypothetical protein